VPNPGRLESLVAAWRRRVAAPARQAGLALSVAGFFLAAHAARVGTTTARLGAAALVTGTLLLLLLRAVRRGRTFRDPRRTLGLLLGPVDADLAARVQRALTLVERAEAGTLQASATLARAHFERLLDRAPPTVVEAAAAGRARRLRRVTALFAVVALAAFALGPMCIIEGLDVLVARHGRGPLPLVWLDEVTIVAHPPGYLRRVDRYLLPGVGAREALGAEVSVRGSPRRPGRQLLLTDGSSEVPFVDDGEGGVVARWTLDHDVDLRVAARFGEVLVVEPDGVAIEAVADESPAVVLDGAPRTLGPTELGSHLELRYAVVDDHGLRQVDLVLRAGGREDRRALARLDGEARRHAGGYVLLATDPFLRRGYLPTLVTIEARDNQPSDAPRWGRSPAITIIPPPIGQPEAHRLRALEAASDAVVDLLAWQLGGGAGTPAEAEHVRRAGAIVAAALEAAADALPVPDGLATFVRGQARALTQIAPGTSTVRAAEEVALALDVALGRLALRDARDVSARLAEVAEEAAAGARLASQTEQYAAGLDRFDAAVTALGAGVAELVRLGALGRDLGGVAEGSLDRMGRARGADDLRGAELAARHLAARLRRPQPSFSARQTGGVESSGGPALDAGEASQADQRFDELAQDLERLIQEHASHVGVVERALSDAERAGDLEPLKQEAHRRATEIARAAAELPAVGDEPGSSRSAAARAREQALSMAQSLERLSLGEAAQRGREALATLDEARRKRGSNDPSGTAADLATLDGARRRVAEHLAWAEQELERARRLADERARGALQSAAARERSHADRAGNIAGRGRNGQSSLPEELIARLEQAEALMRDAARSLDEGRGREALELERDAQRLLEQSAPGKTTAEGANRDRSADGVSRGTHGEVPGEEEDRAQDFRRRVVEGLATERSGRLAPAVRRYAEGLLR